HLPKSTLEGGAPSPPGVEGVKSPDQRACFPSRPPPGGARRAALDRVTRRQLSIFGRARRRPGAGLVLRRGVARRERAGFSGVAAAVSAGRGTLASSSESTAELTVRVLPRGRFGLPARLRTGVAAGAGVASATTASVGEVGALISSDDVS